MIKVLFIGGFKHKQIEEVPGDCMLGPEISVRMAIVPYDPDELRRDPIRAAILLEYEYYHLRHLQINKWRMAYVYVLSGIRDEVLEIYMQEPGMQERVAKVAV